MCIRDSSSTLLTLLVVPVIYIMLDDLAEWVKGRTRRRRHPAAPSAEEATT